MFPQKREEKIQLKFNPRKNSGRNTGSSLVQFTYWYCYLLVPLWLCLVRDVGQDDAMRYDDEDFLYLLRGEAEIRLNRKQQASFSPLKTETKEGEASFFEEFVIVINYFYDTAFVLGNLLV